MAGIAAGVVLTEQVISSTVEVGAAGFAIGKPSNGLKANFAQIATASADGTSTSLVRSNHTLTVVGDRAYVFGGHTESSKLANNSVHSFALPTKGNLQSDYHLSPAIAATNGGPVPAERTNHSACALGDSVAIFGGRDESGNVIQDPLIWLHDTRKAVWEAILPEESSVTPPVRSEAKLFCHGNDFLLYGGKDSEDSQLLDLWLFNASVRTWTRLPDAPIFTPNAAYGSGSLYLISATDNLSSALHHLDIATPLNEPPSWETLSFPTNPLTPGPRPRENGGLVHITTGFGRTYLLYFFGDRQTSESGPMGLTTAPTQWSDIWTLQLPARNTKRRSSIIAEALNPAKLKDAIRLKLGVDVGTFGWEEVEVKPPVDLLEPEGKVHPGPRGSFGYDVLANGRDVAFWGGTNAKGEREGDGWIVQLE